MSKLHWVVEDFLADGTVNDLVNEILTQGMTCDVVRYIPFETNQNVFSRYPGEACVLFIGSVNMTLKVQHHTQWIPGGFSNFKALECTSYYAHLGKHLLNSDYVIVPFGDLMARPMHFFDRFPWDDDPDCGTDHIFIRPNGNSKAFNACVVARDNFKKDMSWAIDAMKPEDLVVVASPKNIQQECRFVVTKNEVITGSTYRLNKKHHESPEYPQEAYDLALEIASGEFQPDLIWVVDIAISGDQCYLLEIGGFSCAGMYRGDLKKIVKRASELAIKEYQDYQEFSEVSMD